MASNAKLPPLPPWGTAVAGATGAVMANAIVYPLDIVKTRLQVQVKHRLPDPDPSSTTSATPSRPLTPMDPAHYTSTLDAVTKILSDEGLGGLYNGIHSSLLGVASTNFAYFYWYSIVRTLYSSYQRRYLSLAVAAPLPSPSTAVELALGAVAGAIAQVFTIPVSVITTRQQVQKRGEKKGLVETGREVVDSEDGWTGLWRGLKASLVLVVNPAITYGAYERLREALFGGKKRLAPWESFLLGALSKSLATLVTQPLIVAKVGLQSRPPPARRGKPFRTFGEVMAYIVQHEGVMGLFKGIGPQITKGLLVQGVLMMVKERVEILFVLLFAYVRRVRAAKLQHAAESVAARAKSVMPVVGK